LKQYVNLGRKTISDKVIRRMTIDEIKYLLCIEGEYPLYSDFKKRVILKSQREINEYSDLFFELEEIKLGRKVHAIDFIIIVNNRNSSEVVENQMELEDTQNEIEKNETKKIISDFHSKYNGTLDYLLIKNLVKMKGIDCVKECIQEFVNFVGNANKVENTFYDFTKKYGTEKAYTKPTTFHNLKPIQATNYDQREYDDNFFNSLYDNVTFTKR
jgi:plasmid replication initiation protein